MLELENMLYFWLIALVIFGLIEASTAGLTSIWFALGAIGAMAASALGAGYVLQIVVFIVISGASLVLLRPLARDFLNKKKISTNADRAIGQTGVVKQRICNLEGMGQVYIDGKLWTARSAGGEDIDEEEKVDVLSIEGVKLIVQKHTDNK